MPTAGVRVPQSCHVERVSGWRGADTETQEEFGDSIISLVLPQLPNEIPLSCSPFLLCFTKASVPSELRVKHLLFH